MPLLRPLTSVDSKGLVLRAILSCACLQHYLCCHYLRHGLRYLGFLLYHFIPQQPLTRGYIGLVWPSSYLTWLGVSVHRTTWIYLNRGVFHHPVSWSSDCGIFIFRRCIVRHPQFLFFLASQSLSQLEYLRARRVCCASDYLRTPGTLAWRILCVLCSPFLWLPLPQGFFIEWLLCLAPSGCLYHWRYWRPPPFLYDSSGALAWLSLLIPAPRGCAI